ncbi:MAG: hypothetical protein AAFX08_06820 [Pseudomonadota bacterium]
MRLKSFSRSIMLAGSALALVAACSEADVESLGGTGPVTVGGGQTGPTGPDLDFVPAAGCPAGTVERSGTDALSVGGVEIAVCAIDGGSTIQTDLSLPLGTYAIEGAVFIGNDNANNATLTIAPGSTLFGSAGNDYIVVSRGSQIIADGTADAPIVFTSAADIADGDVNDGESSGDPEAFGEWGGLVISGNAPINDCNDESQTGGTVECVKFGEGNSGLFGGADPADDFGTLRYVRVQYAGFRVNDEDELNGIAFQGTGNGGTAEFIQVHNNLDDGIEWFGGTTDVRYAIVSGAGDDSFDWTDGWVGNIQFAIVQQSEVRGDRGIEGDNRNGDNNITPRSNPNFANFTFIGGESGDTGMVIRRGNAGKYVNGIIVDFQDAAIDFDDQATVDQIATGELQLRSLFLANNNENFEGSSTEVDTDDDGEGDSPDGFEDDIETLFNSDPNNTIAAGTTLDGVFPGPTEANVTAFDASTLSSFLINTDYVGAFPNGTTDDSADNWARGWTIALDGVTGAGGEVADSCPEGTFQSNETVPAGRSEERICVVSQAVYTSDLTLTGGNLYELRGAVFIGNDNEDSATLTINPGVTIFGSGGSDYLIISRGSQIRSLGTPQAPVVMTSRPDVLGTVDPVNDFGQWGGLVISGNAPINDCNDESQTGGTVECVKFGEGNSGLFGGADAEDDSGEISYTRVQYAGFRVNDEDELNGIAFQAVGSEGEFDFIQVHNNLDDGLEWFGGAANAKHIVVTGAGDDSLDWTDGWVGNVQYAIVVQTREGAGDRGIEGDNRNGDNDITPRSSPTISNFTFVGGSSDVGFGDNEGDGFGDTGMVIRRGSAGIYANGIITNWDDAAIDLDEQATVDQIGTPGSGALQFRSLYIVDNNESFEGSSTEIDTDDDGEGDSPDGFEDDTEALFDATGANNVDGDDLSQASTLTVGVDDSVTAALVPGANEDAVTATDPTTFDSFFDSVDYIGAVEDDDDNWYVGWTFGL